MPALPNVPQVLKFQLRWRVEGDLLAMTNHYFRYTGGPPSASNCADMATNAVAAASDGFQALAANYVGIDDAECTDLTSDTAGQGVGGTPWVGTRGTALLSPATAVLVNHSVNRRYRGGKPRSYMPLGIASDLTTAGVWTSAFITAVLSGWETFRSEMVSAGSGCTISGIVNVSYYQGFTVVTSPTTHRSRNVPTLRPTPIVDTINSSSVAQLVASQRRRNRSA